jgi:hypothetical protein
VVAPRSWAACRATPRPTTPDSASTTPRPPSPQILDETFFFGGAVDDIDTGCGAVDAADVVLRFTLAARAGDEPTTPQGVRPFSPTPGPVEDTIVRLLQKSPAQHFGSAMALGGHLAWLSDIADHPLEPSSSRLRTVADLQESDATETGCCSTRRGTAGPAARNQRRSTASAVDQQPGARAVIGAQRRQGALRLRPHSPSLRRMVCSERPVKRASSRFDICWKFALM